MLDESELWVSGQAGELTKEEAEEELGKCLCFKMWHLEPDTDAPPRWAELSDFERSYYLSIVEWLLSHRELIAAAS